MKKLFEKIHLNEEDEPLPAVELEEPLQAVPEAELDASAEEVPEEVKDNTIMGLVGGLLSDEWKSIDSINSIISTLILEFPDRQDVVDTLNEVITEKSAIIGLLDKLAGVKEEEKDEVEEEPEEEKESEEEE